MRRIWGILLFLFLVAPLATTVVIVKIQEGSIRREVKGRFLASVDKKDLVRFSTAHGHGLQLAADEAHEFEHEGQMYDVLRTEVRGDTTYYLCWRDQAETALHDQLDHLIAQAVDGDPNRHEQETRLFKFLDSLFFAPAEQPMIMAVLAERNSWHTRQVTYQSAYRATPYSPPEIA